MKQSVITSKPQRENSGAMASNRFSFQINWGVSKLIDLHKSSDPYFLLMEQHEDALICDDLLKPNYIKLYQIKTKKGVNWKFAGLTSLNSSNSIVGKLYQARDNFLPMDVELFFITDAYFELKDQSNKKKTEDSFLVSELSSKDMKRLKQSIESCIPINRGDDLNALFNFEKISMNSDGHEIYTQGLLSEYFSVVLDKPFKKSSYYFIAGEVRKRNNYEKKVRTLGSLKKLKSISREDFDSWIVYCVKNTRIGDSIMDNLKQELRQEALSFVERKSIERNATEYFLKIKSNDSSFQKLSDLIIRAESSCPGTSILQLADNIFNHIEGRIKFMSHYSKDFIVSCILYELCR